MYKYSYKTTSIMIFAKKCFFMISIFVSCYHAQNLKLVYKIVPNSDYKQAHMTNDYHRLSEMSTEYVDYEFIAKWYPIIYEKCYEDIVFEFVMEKTDKFNDSAIGSYILNVLDRMSLKVYNILCRFIANHDEQEQFLMELKDKIQTYDNICDCVDPSELSITIEDHRMLFYVVNILVNKLIYRGLKVISKYRSNLDFTYSNFYQSHVAENKHRDLGILLGVRTVNGTYIGIEELGVLNVDEYPNRIANEAVNNVICEFDITLYILDHIFTFMRHSFDENYENASIDYATLEERISNAFVALGKSIKHFLITYGNNNRRNFGSFRSFILQFDSNRALHFMRYYFTLPSQETQKLFDCLKSVCHKTSQYQQTLSPFADFVSLQHMHNQNNYISLTSLIFSYNHRFTNLVNLMETLDKYHNYDEFFHFVNVFTFGVMHLSAFTEGSNTPMLSMEQFNHRFKHLFITYKKRLSGLKFGDIRRVHLMSQNELDILKAAYLAAQQFLLIGECMHLNYTPFESDTFKFDVKDYKTKHFIDGILTYHGRLYTTENEEVGKETIGKFMEQKYDKAYTRPFKPKQHKRILRNVETMEHE